MTPEEILRLILAAVTASLPSTQPAGSGDATGRATPTPQPQPVPIPPTQPTAGTNDVFARILGTVFGTVIPLIAAQRQAQSPQQNAGISSPAPSGTAQPTGTAQPLGLLLAQAADTGSQPAFPATPTDLALGETIGTPLAGRKTVIAMIAYAVATALKAYNPALGATIDTIMPLIYALGGWGALGKLDKWVGALAKKPTEILAAPGTVDVKLP